MNIAKSLELDKILNLLANHASSMPAKERCKRLRAEPKKENAERMLLETAEAEEVLYVHAESFEFLFEDISGSLQKAKKGGVLSQKELLEIARCLRIARLLKSGLSGVSSEIPHLKKYIQTIALFDSVEKEIGRCVVNEAEIADHASAALSEIRKGIKQINAGIRKELHQMIASSDMQSHLQEHLITIRNGRYVVPVKSESKSKVKGLVHDRSATGSTLYIEPYAVVELNNQLKELELRERDEIERILASLSISVGSIHEELQNNCEIIIILDVIFAKAKFAHALKAVRPKLNDAGIISIQNGRHPLIDRQKVIPVSISLGDEYDVLLITGPNTGGKTVTLKLAGLFSAMAMCGLFIPCDEGSEVSCFERIFCDIGDEQSIEQSLSTFSSHISNISAILKSVNARSLVLLDELGAGTDPAEGSALAVAITEKLLSCGAKAIITTHYAEMKAFSSGQPRMQNASMGFDSDSLRPTYKLFVGLAGSSNALIIAERLGISAQIIQKAKEKLSKGKLEYDRITMEADKMRRMAESDLVEAEQTKRDIRNLKAEIEAQKAVLDEKQQVLDEKLRKSTKLLMADYLAEADEIIEMLKDKLSAQTEQALFEARTLKNKLVSAATEKQGASFDRHKANTNSPIAVGDSVFVHSLNTEAEVLKINEKRREYEVAAGLIKTKIKFDDASKIETRTITGANKIQKTAIDDAAKSVLLEINVIGKTVEEAWHAVDQFIDDSVRAGLDEIRVIHGKGTGKLRKALQAEFRRDLRILSFRDGRYGEGENGVTVVELK